jgi:hypothetical protein
MKPTTPMDLVLPAAAAMGGVVYPLVCSRCGREGAGTAATSAEIPKEPRLCPACREEQDRLGH